MRHYHVAAASHAIDCPAKWLDNVLSQGELAGVARARQGVARKISMDAVLHLAVARRVAHDLDVPLRPALAIAARLVASGGRAAFPNGTAVLLDVERLREHIERRLEEAAEVLVPPRRGRPPRRPRARHSGD